MNGLDSLAAEAARVFRVPVAWVGLLRDDGEEVVAGAGTKARLVPLEMSIAARIRDATDVVVVPDATRDARFSGHPFVVGPPHFHRLLLASRLDTEQQDFAHQARSSAEELLSIVSNILYISNLRPARLPRIRSTSTSRTQSSASSK